MKYIYDPHTAMLSVNVSQQEFALACRVDPNTKEMEYRVFEQKFTPDKFNKFIRDYSFFIKQILEIIFPNENIHDIVSLSTSSDGQFQWKSLLDVECGYSNPSFLSNLVNYGVAQIKKNMQNAELKDESTLKDISDEDNTKLALIYELLDWESIPEVFQRSKKKGSKYKAREKALRKLNLEIEQYEYEFGFSSDQLLLYYSDDQFLDEKMKKWFVAHNKREDIYKEQEREILLKDFIDNWGNLF